MKAYRAPGGGIAFDSKRGYGDRPLELPCGQCIGCRIKHSRTWALRCVHEALMHRANSFITLTYDPEHLPKDLSVSVEDWQLFAKRLRKTGKFRFFHCGEYGSENLRPHYHAIIFGRDFSGDRVYYRGRPPRQLFVSPTLSKAWGKGFVSIGDVTYQSAAYVARYALKKRTGDQAEAAYTRVDHETGECWRVKPEYVTMSRRPGIGATWFEKYASDVYPDDVVIHDGKRFRPPRFYDGKIDEDLLLSLKAKRLEAARMRGDELNCERLAQREIYLESEYSDSRKL